VKVPLHVVQARRERLAQLIEQHRYLPVKELCRRLGVSEATARRDLAALVHEKKITRTYGGALSDFNDRFPSFRERQRHASKGKRRIAEAALAFIEPNGTYFFDSGTTICAVAEAFRERPVTPVTIVTSNLPVGEMLASIPEVQVFLVAGQLLHLQSTLLGEIAQKSLAFWNFDLALMSAEGMNAAGIWNSQASIVDQQKVVLSRSARNLFCLDATKLNRSAPHFLVSWERVDGLLTEVPQGKLRRSGIEIGENRYCQAGKPRLNPLNSRLSPGPPPTAEGDEFPVHIL
jgi:DeoR/GlpR family transcriptional regulator of sugar metabolism